MAKKKQPEAPPVETFPTGQALAELKALLKERNQKKRGQAAWHLMLQAAPNSDFPVVLDFAVENSLVHAPEAGRGRQSFAWTNPIDGSEMIWIAPGRFFIGLQREESECPGFSLARFPVTNEQFARFMEATNYQPPQDHPDLELFLHHWTKGNPPKGKEKHPVVYVSYIDALHYCRWAGMHLPTEWQWEKAASGPDGRRFPWGADPPGQHRGGALAQVRSKATCPVGNFSRVRTPYGCEDMIGNVSEWCHQDNKKNYTMMPAPIPAEGPVIADTDGYAAVRGSCFMRMDSKLMTSAHRRQLSKIRRNYWTGFRPVFLHPWCPVQE